MIGGYSLTKVPRLNDSISFSQPPFLEGGNVIERRPWTTKSGAIPDYLMALMFLWAILASMICWRRGVTSRVEWSIGLLRRGFLKYFHVVTRVGSNRKDRNIERLAISMSLSCLGPEPQPIIRRGT